MRNNGALIGCACGTFILLLGGLRLAIPVAKAADDAVSARGPLYHVVQVGIPILGVCESESRRIVGSLDQALGTANAGGVSPDFNPQCIPFGGDPDAWLVLELTVVEEERALAVIIPALRKLGVSPDAEISYEAENPNYEAVRVGPGPPTSRSSARTDNQVLLDVGTSVSEARKAMKFESGDILLIEAATGQRAVVQFAVVGLHHVEYRWRYRAADADEVTSGHASAAEKYRVIGHYPNGTHLGALPGHDVILRIGAMRAEWSAAGGHAGFVYYEPGIASMRIAKDAQFEKLP